MFVTFTVSWTLHSKIGMPLQRLLASMTAKAPTAAPFHYADNKAIVVFDGDDSALRLAHVGPVGRTPPRHSNCCRRNRNGTSEGSSTALSGLLSAIRLKRAHTQARKGIDQALSSFSCW